MEDCQEQKASEGGDRAKRLGRAYKKVQEIEIYPNDISMERAVILQEGRGEIIWKQQGGARSTPTSINSM